MSKVMLINPPWSSLLGDTYNEIPIGLCYIAGMLKKNKIDVKILNADYVEKRHHSSSKEKYKSYNYYKEVLSNIKHPVWKEIINQIKTFSPDFVGLHLKTSSYKSAENIAKLIKGYNQKIIIIVGGPHASIAPKETISEKHFDYVVKGEGELTFLELIKKLEKNKSVDDVLGITFREGKRIIDNPERPLIQNLDELPFPERDVLLHKEKYHPNAFGLMFTARGCPFNCIYCASNKIWGRSVRFRSPKNIIEEIKYVKKKYGTSYFKIRDDTFTVNQKRAEEICDLIIKSKLNIAWHCDTRADCVNEALIKKMKIAGCTHVSIGVESGNERILKYIKKSETKEQMKKAVRAFKKNNISVSVFIMIGFPTETEKEMWDTIKFVEYLKPDFIVLSIVTPYPGTELYSISKRLNLIKTPIIWENFFHQSPEMCVTSLDKKRFDKINEKFLRIVENYNKNKVRLAKHFIINFIKDPRFALKKVSIYLQQH